MKALTSQSKGTDVAVILDQRNARYGDFYYHSQKAEALKEIVRTSLGWEQMAVDQRHALDVICDKIARMCNGDPHYIDTWLDIEGYARLVRTRLEAEQVGQQAQPSSVELPILLHKSEDQSK